MLFTLLIISKSGGLLYNRTLAPGLTTLSTNDYLVLAGTFHGVHAITRSLTPSSIARRPPHYLPPSSASDRPLSASSTGSTLATSFSAAGSSPLPSGAVATQRAIPVTGLEVLETAHFRLTCFETVSGTKFLLFSEPTQPNLEAVMRRIYELYADFVLKNPFYQLEMPVRCEAFDRELMAYVRGK